ncbi:MAG: hypothetical protein QHH75_11370 [Bacillota bacterium]|nr:hypothetical protein [Bacillota bacterium]
MRRLFFVLAVVSLTAVPFILGGCLKDLFPSRPAGTGAPSQAREGAPGSAGTESSAPGTPQSGDLEAAEKLAGAETFVHRFMRYRLLDPFGDRAYAMLTDQCKQIFINSSDPTLGGSPVMQRMVGYRLEGLARSGSAVVATVTVWLTGPAEKAESMYYQEKITLLPQGEGFAVGAWESSEPVSVYAGRQWTAIVTKKPGAGEHPVLNISGVPTSFSPQGDNPEQTGRSAGEFKSVAAFPAGPVAFATMGIFGAVIGVVDASGQVRVLAEYDNWVHELVWSPGGHYLAVEAMASSGRHDLAVFDVKANKRLFLLSGMLPQPGVELNRGCWLDGERYFYFFSRAAEQTPLLWVLDLKTGQVKAAKV